MRLEQCLRILGNLSGNFPEADFLERHLQSSLDWHAISHLRRTLAYESGEWEAAAWGAEGLHLNAKEVAALHWQAQQWAREVSVGG
jgi:hypothetical protein